MGNSVALASGGQDVRPDETGLRGCGGRTMPAGRHRRTLRTKEADERQDMGTHELQDKVTELATEHGVVGVAVGVLIDGAEHYAFHGVTSVENPLPVDD